MAIPRGNPVPLTVDIQTWDHGVPGTKLGSVTTPLQLFGNYVDLTNINFKPAGVVLSAGVDYFAVFSTAKPAPDPKIGYYDLLTVAPNALSSGYSNLISYTGGTAPWYTVIPFYATI